MKKILNIIQLRDIDKMAQEYDLVTPPTNLLEIVIEYSVLEEIRNRTFKIQYEGVIYTCDPIHELRFQIGSVVAYTYFTKKEQVT